MSLRSEPPAKISNFQEWEGSLSGGLAKSAALKHKSVLKIDKLECIWEQLKLVMIHVQKLGQNNPLVW